ncbi:MAG TPA: hypothetical protein V6D17_12735 [Candidatus Obscuribacterales bacterium]
MSALPEADSTAAGEYSKSGADRVASSGNDDIASRAQAALSHLGQELLRTANGDTFTLHNPLAIQKAARSVVAEWEKSLDRAPRPNDRQIPRDVAAFRDIRSIKDACRQPLAAVRFLLCLSRKQCDRQQTEQNRSSGGFAAPLLGHQTPDLAIAVRAAQNMSRISSSEVEDQGNP